jgi:hypothetical protein
MNDDVKIVAVKGEKYNKKEKAEIPWTRKEKVNTTARDQKIIGKVAHVHDFATQ